MAQVVATRSIQGSNGGSASTRSDKFLKPASFAVKVLGNEAKKSGRVSVRGGRKVDTTVRSARVETQVIPVSPEDVPNREEQLERFLEMQKFSDTSVGMWSKPTVRRKTKIVCTVGPSTNTREMIWKLAEAGMNVARMNMSHGDHASHKKVIDLVKEYNAQSKDNTIAIMLDTKGPEVRSGDLPQPIMLDPGQEFTFTIERGVSIPTCVSVNYDDFVNDVEAGDMLLVDGGMMSFMVKSKTKETVICEVVDGGELKSRRHLNVRGKSATLPSITEKDWEDIKFGVENKVDFYAETELYSGNRFPLKAAGVMHTVALRTEATITTSTEMPPNLGQAFKNHMSEMFAYHATMMSNTLGTSTVVFTRTGFMAILLSHYRPSGTIYAFTNEKKIQQRLALYQGVCPIYMEFSDDAEDTFTKALATLLKQGMVKKGEEIAIVQSGSQPIWRSQSTHNIQVRKV
ncbi:hypothetical protein F2Q68_00008222 [Brassica cretica]|uniref:pyruvate kinase n=1 Tax=Brassica cretica TaxID=69181 RepID=A0A8S9KP90_BRACR|nr:hypothetical protein F2Q68_00008222 [Brassica cretica]